MHLKSRLFLLNRNFRYIIHILYLLECPLLRVLNIRNPTLSLALSQERE